MHFISTKLNFYLHGDKLDWHHEHGGLIVIDIVIININTTKPYGHLHGDRLDGLTGGHRSAAVDHLHLVQQPGRNSSCFTFFEKPTLIFYIFYLVVFICCFRFPFDVEGLFIWHFGQIPKLRELKPHWILISWVRIIVNIGIKQKT